MSAIDALKRISKAERRSQNLQKTIVSLFLSTCGVFSAGFGLKGFLLPNHFIDGGVMGISLLTNVVADIDLSILVVLFNLPFIYMGLKQVGLRFALTTIYSILALSLVLWLVDFPVITKDKLLISAFGGFFLGSGIGLCIRGGSVIDGTEILAIYVSRKSSLTIGDVILIINLIIFSVTAIVINVETAMYAIVTYFAASRTVDFLVQGIEEYTAVTIVSDNWEPIREGIITRMGRGVTLYNGQRGYGKRGSSDQEIKIVYTVITRLEIPKLRNIVGQIDPNSFMVMNSVSETKGGVIKQRPLH